MFRFVSAALVSCLALAGSCSDPEPKADPDTSTPADAADVQADDGAMDTDVVVPIDPDRVEIDRDADLPAPGAGTVSVRRAEAADLIPSEVPDALPGDFLFENAHGRYVVGFGKRAIGPCSWDGNPIATEAVLPAGGTGDVLGQICFLLNVAQTVAPEHAEILEDGSNGRALVAITGRIVPLDFLNLGAMIDSFAPGLSDALDLDPDRPLPFRVTFYYALTPESRSLRVLTAVRNDGVEDEYYIAVQLMLSGSTGAYFTPLGGRKGWGYASLGPDSLVADPVSFIGYFSKHAGYAVVPDPDAALEHPLPVGAGMLAVSGAAALVFGTTDVLSILLAPREDWPFTPGMQRVPVGGVQKVGYRLYPSDGSVATAADPIYEDLGVATSIVSGRVVDADGAPRPGVQVSALKDGDRAYNMAVTKADGRFAMRVPHGNWTLRLRADEVPTTVSDVTTSGAPVDLGDMALTRPGLLNIAVTTPAGAPTPARVVIACATACPDLLYDSRERDSSFSPPNGWFRLIELGVDGRATVPLPAGAYTVSVNRGMSWSTWPADATENGGEAVAIVAGETVEFAAEIARVVDTSGALGADFHVHAMASPDSQVADAARILDLMAGGLDVVVSTDHDAIADYAPAIAGLGAGDQIASIVGSEITTSGFGHVNAFPLTPDPEARRGGPIDWSGDGVYHVTLDTLVDLVQAHPGEQVVQLNHPSSPMGAIGLLEVDVLTGHTFADAASLRMRPTEADPTTGDTGLWSERFDAIEIYNGFSTDDFNAYFRWWLAMIGRGFSPTGTAVTDTHGLYGSLGASPRSYVFVDAGADTPAGLDVGHLVERVQHGAVIGTNGPFMRVDIENTDAERAGPGDTLRVGDGTALLKVTIAVPTWIDVDRLDVYMNVPGEGLIGRPGEAIKTELEPTLSVPVVWEASHRETVATGRVAHVRLQQVVEVPLTVTDDAYVVVVVRGLEARSMRLVVGSDPAPLAFSNPVFIDADGGGYDKPPLMGLRAARMAAASAASARPQRASKAVLTVAPGTRPTVEDLGVLFDALTCKHGPETHGHATTPHHHPKVERQFRPHAHPHPHPHGHGHAHRH